MSARGADLLGMTVGYAIGSLPFGVWLGRAKSGLDVRDHGSGSMGTTNVLRIAGPAAGAAVFILDVAKGGVAVVVARSLGADEAGEIAAGLAAVVGHSWPVFAHFRGGKSVATAFGGLLVLSPVGSVTAVVGGLSALAASRRMSVGSLTATSAATVGAGAEWAAGRSDGAPFAYAVAVTALIFVRHAPNLRRLMAGTEPKLSLKKKTQAARPPA